MLAGAFLDDLVCKPCFRHGVVHVDKTAFQLVDDGLDPEGCRHVAKLREPSNKRLKRFLGDSAPGFSVSSLRETGSAGFTMSRSAATRKRNGGSRASGMSSLSVRGRPGPQQGGKKGVADGPRAKEHGDVGEGMTCRRSAFALHQQIPSRLHRRGRGYGRRCQSPSFAGSSAWNTR